MPVNKEKSRKAAVDTVKRLRARERQSSQSRHVNIINGDLPADNANVRLHEHFKRLDRFKASSMSRGSKKVAR